MWGKAVEIVFGIIASLLGGAGVYEAKRQADFGDANNAVWFQLYDNMKELCGGAAQQIRYADRCGWAQISPGDDVRTFIVYASDSSCDPNARMISFLDDRISIHVVSGDESRTMPASQAKALIDDYWSKGKKCDLQIGGTVTGSGDSNTPADQGADQSL